MRQALAVVAAAVARQRDRPGRARLDHLDGVLAADGLTPAVRRQERDRARLVENLGHSDKLGPPTHRGYLGRRIDTPTGHGVTLFSPHGSSRYTAAVSRAVRLHGNSRADATAAGEPAVPAGADRLHARGGGGHAARRQHEREAEQQCVGAHPHQRIDQVPEHAPARIPCTCGAARAGPAGRTGTGIGSCGEHGRKRIVTPIGRLPSGSASPTR